MYKIQRDKYQKSRGGHSRILDVCCEHCGAHTTYYQKDGPGMLKRMYVDRFIDAKPVGEKLACGSCAAELGIRFNYKKENRPAYRLFVGSVTKKVVRQEVLLSD